MDAIGKHCLFNCAANIPVGDGIAAGEAVGAAGVAVLIEEAVAVTTGV
jgi:hypothetical protein